MNIKEFKEIINDLPDDMQVLGLCGNGVFHSVSHFIISEDNLTNEEIKNNYPLGVSPTLIITID